MTFLVHIIHYKKYFKNIKIIYNLIYSKNQTHKKTTPPFTVNLFKKMECRALLCSTRETTAKTISHTDKK